MRKAEGGRYTRRAAHQYKRPEKLKRQLTQQRRWDAEIETQTNADFIVCLGKCSHSLPGHLEF